MIVAVALIRWADISLFQTDFAMFYTAADLANDGRWDAVYDLTAFERRFLLLTGLPDGPGVPTFGYPPILAQILQPLVALVSLPMATLVFSGLGLLAAVDRLRALGMGWRGILLLLAFYPTTLSLELGQNSLFSLAAVAGFVGLMLRQRPVLAGLVLGLLVYKPQLLAAVGLFLLLAPRRHRKVIMGAAAGATSLVVASIGVAPSAWKAFPAGLRSLVAVSGNGFRVGQVSAINFSFLLFGDETWKAPVLAVVLAALGIFWFFRNRGDGQDLEREIAAGIVLACWVNPWMFVYEWVLLAIPAMYVTCHRLLSRRRAWLVYATAALVVPYSAPLALRSVRLIGTAIQWSVPLFAVVVLLAFRGDRLMESRRGEVASGGARIQVARRVRPLRRSTQGDSLAGRGDPTG